jgi:pimeloyl-ACP methyl ester carboxylesterase
MSTVVSKDGTTIAYNKIGSGPPVILVDGALCYRESGPNEPLAAELKDHFTVFTYDRRGRGESTDVQPYSVEREIEDIEALISEAGGEAYLYGISSGAALALEAANAGLSIKKLALYEAPFIVDDTRDPVSDNYLDKLRELLAADKRSAAVKHFMKNAVGLPSMMVFFMPLMPAWSKLKSVAHTLPYDAIIVEKEVAGKPFPVDRWDSVNIPTIVIDGEKSQPWMHNGMKSLAEHLHARYHTLEGQSHIVKPEVLAPVLNEFFNKKISMERVTNE